MNKKSDLYSGWPSPCLQLCTLWACLVKWGYIFSDTDSQESVKKRYVKYGYTYGTLFLLYFFIFFSSNSWNLDKILNFKSWYFTQGLWEMEGMWFWKAFIFETPFVLLRVLPLFFFLFLGIYYLLRSLINDDSTVITK